MDLLIISGEASGDEHASLLVKDLNRHFPDLTVAALGGDNLKESGAHLLFNLAEHAVVGIIEVLKNYGFFKKIFNHTLAWIRDNKPRVVLLVDYPGFNLRLANALMEEGLSCKGGGDIKVLQYVSPQLWAWKPNRRFKMEKVLDGLAVIFPFEVDCYEDVELPVSFVGHPFVDEKYSCPVRYDKNGPLLLLPGSRIQPIERILPVFLDACENMDDILPKLKIQLPVPNQQIKNTVQKILSSRIDLEKRIEITEDLSNLKARAAFMSSGTMSLACALAGIPGIIAYKAHPITYLVGRALIRVPFLGMANLLLSENPPYIEMIQGRATGNALAVEMRKVILNTQIENHYVQASDQLKEILKSPQESGVAEWLSDEMGLG